MQAKLHLAAVRAKFTNPETPILVLIVAFHLERKPAP
jgi:hypothetical protein